MNWSRLLTQRRLAVLGALGLPLLLVVLYTYQPNEASYYPRCTFYKATGWHCAGCGTARCLHALLHGRLFQAAAYNIFIVLALPFLSVWAVRHSWAVWRGKPAPRPLLPPWAVPYLVVLVIAFWVARNIPSYPFTLLAPHELQTSSVSVPQVPDEPAEAFSGAQSGR